APFVRWLGPIPTLTLVGLAALAVYILFFYPLATNDTLGANSSTGWWATAIIAAIGILIFPISYAINKARGVDLGMAFRELPPE
ncbi:MAG: hypothetical protein ACRDNG_12970, partial [Gaiellaceae bacterium]